MGLFELFFSSITKQNDSGVGDPFTYLQKHIFKAFYWQYFPHGNTPYPNLKPTYSSCTPTCQCFLIVTSWPDWTQISRLTEIWFHCCIPLSKTWQFHQRNINFFPWAPNKIDQFEMPPKFNISRKQSSLYIIFNVQYSAKTIQIPHNWLSTGFMLKLSIEKCYLFTLCL